APRATFRILAQPRAAGPRPAFLKESGPGGVRSVSARLRRNALSTQFPILLCDLAEMVSESPQQTSTTWKEREAYRGSGERDANRRRHAPPWLKPDMLGRVEMAA